MPRWLNHPALIGQLPRETREGLGGRALLYLGLGLPTLIVYGLHWALVRADIFAEPLHALVTIGASFLVASGTCWGIAQPRTGSLRHELLCAALLAPLLGLFVWCVGVSLVALACAQEGARLYLKGLYETSRRGLLIHPVLASLGFAYLAAVACLLRVRLEARPDPPA